MKYLWMIILAWLYTEWTISAIKDFIHYHKSKFDVEIKDSSIGWLVVTILIVFIWSFVLWIVDNRIIG